MMAMRSEYSRSSGAAFVFCEASEHGFNLGQHITRTPLVVMHQTKQRAFRYAKLDALLPPALQAVKLAHRLIESYQHIFHKNHTLGW